MAMRRLLTLAFCVVMSGAAVAADEPFRVSQSTPKDGSTDVATDVVPQVHVSHRFRVETVNDDTIRLWHGGDRVPVRVTTDLGGVITISPFGTLSPRSEYRIELSSSIQDEAGRSLAPFSFKFRTGDPRPPARRMLPPFQATRLGSAPGLTSIALAPDSTLLAATWEGALLRWRLNPESGLPVAAPETIWHPPRSRITGLCVDPDAARNRTLWVALDDNAGASVCELRFTARIVKLTLPESTGQSVVAVDVITGLPVGDHAVSGLTFGPDGRLYFFCGAITMLGADKPGSRETPLSAAVLSADVRSPSFLPVNVSTDPPAKFDATAPDSPVRIFATGIREAYDLCWHSNGSLYAGVNQNDTAEKTPANPMRGLPAVNVRPDEPLIRIIRGGYYGHPNPSRGEWVLLGGNPTAEPDPWEVAALPVGTVPESHFRPDLLIQNLVPLGGQSADGCAEWKRPGPLRGRLLSCFYTTARTIHTFAFSPDGTKVDAEEPLCDAAGAPLKFGAPLDLAIDDEQGRIYVIDFADPRRKDSAGEGAIWLVQPAEARQ
jgi:glucose/arabinose dehydrogenase